MGLALGTASSHHPYPGLSFRPCCHQSGSDHVRASPRGRGLALVAQVLHELPVDVDVGMDMEELAEQGTLSSGVARIEFSDLGIEQILEEQ